MGIKERIESELELLRTYFPEAEYKAEAGHWFRIPDYDLPDGWNREKTDVVFEVKETYPGTQPYGFFVPQGLTVGDEEPKNINKNPSQPPFSGSWIFFSWSPDDNQWKATADLRTGSNLLQWARGFAKRFEQGR